MVSDIFGLSELFGLGHASRLAIESGISNFKLPCKTVHQYLSKSDNSLRG